MTLQQDQRRRQQEFDHLKNSFVHYGEEIVGKKATSREFSKQFLRFFNTSPKICGHSPKHLLWALLFLRSYLKEDILERLIGSSKKTVRKWVWLFVEAIADMKDYVVRTI
jgi:hypothetical protein